MLIAEEPVDTTQIWFESLERTKVEAESTGVKCTQVYSVLPWRCVQVEEHQFIQALSVASGTHL